MKFGRQSKGYSPELIELIRSYKNKNLSPNDVLQTTRIGKTDFYHPFRKPDSMVFCRHDTSTNKTIPQCRTQEKITTNICVAA